MVILTDFHVVGDWNMVGSSNIPAAFRASVDVPRSSTVVECIVVATFRDVVLPYLSSFRGNVWDVDKTQQSMAWVSRG